MLLYQDIHTFEELEALLLLRADPTIAWSVADLAGRLTIPDEIAREALAKLASTGLLDVTGMAPSLRFRYSPASRTLDETTARLAVAYEQSRFDVLNLISRNAVDRVRSSAMRMFANAFVLKSKDKGDRDE